MSYDGYFEGVIRIWKEAKKKTPTMKRDMKMVLQQFDTSLQYDEIPEDKIPGLKRSFKEIYHEVYD